MAPPAIRQAIDDSLARNFVRLEHTRTALQKARGTDKQMLAVALCVTGDKCIAVDRAAQLPKAATERETLNLIFSPGLRPLKTISISPSVNPQSRMMSRAKSRIRTGCPISSTKISPPRHVDAACSTSCDASGIVMKKRSIRKLAALLENDDMRVRLEAQWELANRGEFKALQNAVLNSKNQLARLHGIWGIGQMFRAIPAGDNVENLTALLPLSSDVDPEIRGQALAMLGEAGYVNAFDPLKNALKDTNPRVRRFAALGLSYLLRSERDEMRIDKDAFVYPMVGPGMPYKEMLTGPHIEGREAAPEEEKLDTSDSF